MKIRALLVAMSVATVLTGCQNMDSNGLLSSGAEAFQAYSLSDAQVKTLSDQACQEMDSKATIPPAEAAATRTAFVPSATCIPFFTWQALYVRTF